MICHYQITAKLGSGGMGEVYLATDTKLGRRVALKFLPRTSSQSSGARANLLREARSASQLNHPSILTVYSVDEAGGRDFIVMEHVEGQSLDELIGSRSLEFDEIFRYAEDIADALAAAHEQGLVHHDIKPANILVSKKGQVKIADFGLAAWRGETQEDQADTFAGSPSFMSPEQVEGRQTDHRSDQFSFGSVLYQMITGRLPFSGEHLAAIAYAVVHEEPAAMEAARDSIPDELRRIVLKCLAKDPDGRYATTSQIKDELSAGRMHWQAPIETPIDHVVSLAVLPFANLGKDSDSEYFSDGLTDELITNLGSVPGLRVVSRTSAFQFKGQTDDIRKVATALNVGSVLEGSVRLSGGRLRVTAQLISAADGFHLWTGKFDREMADIFAIQEEIAQRIIDALEVTLTGQHGVGRQQPRTDHLEAFTLYLRARHSWNKRTRQDLKEAIGFLEKAVAIDPAYAPAYAGLANCYSLMPDYADMPPAEAFAKAKAAVKRALELNPNLAEAHVALACILFQYDWEFIRAEREFARAIELNPGYATAHHWYALLLKSLGRFEESLREVQIARELDPLSPIIAVAVGEAWMNLGEHARAHEEFRKVLAEQPEFAPAHFWSGVNLVVQCRYDEGIAAVRRAIDLSGNEMDYLCYLGWAEGLAGQTANAKKALKRLVDVSSESYVQPISIAMVCAGLGEADKAFEWLDKALAERSDALVWLNAFPFFASLRHDLRYPALMGRIGLVVDSVRRTA